MDRHWLLTWTTYGTWLPGDERGFVGDVREQDGHKVRHNGAGTFPEAKRRGMMLAAGEIMAAAPIYLKAEQASPLLGQFQETARFRGWSLIAVGIMANHVHLLVGVNGDPDPNTLMRDFKSYGSRKLNGLFGRPASDTWWTVDGSKRKKQGDAIREAVEYIRYQSHPLLIWIHDEWK